MQRQKNREYVGTQGNDWGIDKSGTTSQMVDKEFPSCFLLQKAS